MRKLNPARTTLVRLLQESFERCTTSAPEALGRAAGRNTRWLFKTYFSPVDITEEIIRPAKAAFEKELAWTDYPLTQSLRRLRQKIASQWRSTRSV